MSVRVIRSAAGAAVVVAALVAAASAAAPAEPVNGPRPEAPLDHAFDFHLRVTSHDPVFTPSTPAEGSHVASGEGEVSGRVDGAVRWSLYENSAAEACTMQWVGEIVTRDGITIPFEGQGLAVVPDPAAPFLWETSGAFRFDAGDGRYAWLGSALFTWLGVSDLQAMEAQLRFHGAAAR